MSPRDEVAVRQEHVLSLLARASAHVLFPDLGFADPDAAAIAGGLAVDRHRYDVRHLRASLERTITVDAIVADFIARNPDGIVVGVHGGLCTRFSRLDNGLTRWIDLDSPELCAFKTDLFDARDNHVIAASCSLHCVQWMACAGRADNVPLLVVADSALRCACIHEIDRFLTSAVELLPAGTEAIVESSALRRSSPEPSRGCLELAHPGGCSARFPRLRFVEPSANAIAHLRLT